MSERIAFLQHLPYFQKFFGNAHFERVKDEKFSGGLLATKKKEYRFIQYPNERLPLRDENSRLLNYFLDFTPIKRIPSCSLGCCKQWSESVGKRAGSLFTGFIVVFNKE